MMNAYIERVAADLARAEADLQDAQARHDTTLAEVRVIEDRLQSVADRRAHIRADLAAGSLDDRQAGSLLALADEDAGDLRQLLTEAQARANAAVPGDEQNAVSLAQNALERIGRENLFAAMHDRTVELEQAFLAALDCLYKTGQELNRGRSLSGIYRISDNLRRVAVHNTVPSQYGARNG